MADNTGRSFKYRHTKSYAKLKVRKNRPAHKAIALHPINLLFLLCVGVMLLASSFKSSAATVTVTATYPAPPLTQPATITTPQDNQQISPQVYTVSGSCPNDSYVILSDNGVMVGTDICSINNDYQISLTLSNGANILQAQDYNVTNSPGPTSTPITVYYEPPVTKQTIATQPVAFVAPPTLGVLQADTDIPYKPGFVPIVSDQLTITGYAPPFSLILVTIHSNPYYCHTTANSQGFWSCTFNQVILPGLHTVYVTAITPSGVKLSMAPFEIRVEPVSPAQRVPSTNFKISASYAYKIYPIKKPVDLNLNIQGGTEPFALSVNWGDGNTSTYLKQSSGTTEISHTYSSLNAKFGSEIIKVEGVDASGSSSTLQMTAELSNPNYVAPKNKTHGFTAFIGNIKPWLIYLWPGYLIVALMVLSFWLGEKQEIRQIINRHSNKPQHHKV